MLSIRAEGALRDRLLAAREDAYAALGARLDAAKTRRLPLDLVAWIAEGAWRSDPATARLRETPLRVFAAAALDRLRRKVRKHGKDLAKIHPDARHDLRKDAKKLRYAVEFLAPLFATEPETKTRKAFVKALRRLQDDLGALNDRQTAQERIAGFGLADTPEAERMLSGWDEAALLADATEALRAFRRREPFWP